MATLVVIDPPGDGAARTSRIDTGAGQPATAPIELPPIGAGCSLCWVFASDWNSFVTFLAAR